MSFGMEIYKEAGGLMYSSDDVTWNQVDFLYCPAGAQIQRDYPALRNREVLTAQVMIDPPPLDRRAIAHTINVSGTIVTVYGGNVGSYVVVLMR